MSVLATIVVILLMLPGAAFVFAIVLVYLFHGPHGIPEPRPGHCPHCGYDLTGNVSGVCPECGQSARQTARPS
jgi:hypothetical protein